MCRLFLISSNLLLVAGLALVTSCKSQRTVTDLGREERSRLFENTMGFKLGDFSKRSEFDAQRTEGERSSFMDKSFGTSKSRLQEKGFAAGEADMGNKVFKTRKGEGGGGFDGASSFQGKQAEQAGATYDGVAKDFGTSVAPERFRRSAGYSATRYDSSPGRLVEGWKSDSQPPRIIQTPDSNTELRGLESADGLRETLGK